jgi:hypothetical protein
LQSMPRKDKVSVVALARKILFTHLLISQECIKRKVWRNQDYLGLTDLLETDKTSLETMIEILPKQVIR